VILDRQDDSSQQRGWSAKEGFTMIDKTISHYMILPATILLLMLCAISDSYAQESVFEVDSLTIEIVFEYNKLYDKPVWHQIIDFKCRFINIGGYIDIYSLSWDDGTDIAVKSYLDHGDYDDPIDSTNFWIHGRWNVDLSGKDFSGFDSVLCHIGIFGQFAERTQSDSTAKY
jgi:hypothetical protein